MLDTLIDRFEELDVNGNGHLDIGVDVPSKEQVAEMQAEVAGTATTLIQRWRERQEHDEAVKAHAAEREAIKKARTGAGSRSSRPTSGSTTPRGSSKTKRTGPRKMPSQGDSTGYFDEYRGRAASTDSVRDVIQKSKAEARENEKRRPSSLDRIPEVNL